MKSLKTSETPGAWLDPTLEVWTSGAVSSSDWHYLCLSNCMLLRTYLWHSLGSESGLLRCGTLTLGPREFVHSLFLCPLGSTDRWSFMAILCSLCHYFLWRDKGAECLD